MNKTTKMINKTTKMIVIIKTNSISGCCEKNNNIMYVMKVVEVY